jgi:hypothetical protein
MEIMKKILACVLLFASFGVCADDDIKYSLGLKIWNHTFATPSKTSLTANSPLVSGSVKYKDFSFTASSLLQTTYVDSSNSVLATRTDVDYAFGYTVFDKVTLILGSKTISGPNEKDMVGMFYGLSAAQPIHEQGFVFGTFVQSNNVSNLDGLSADGKFSLVDVGYGHVINKNTTVNIGYRQQIFTTAVNDKYTLGGITFGVGFNF